MTRQIARAVSKAANGGPPAATPPAEQPPPSEAPRPATPTVDGVPVNMDPRIPKIAHLTVSAQELQVIYGALDEVPGKFGRVLYGKIAGQVQEQIDAALAKPPAK